VTINQGENMNYEKTVEAARKAWEHNDCAVKALAIACDVPYPVAHKTLKQLGRRGRCGTRRTLTIEAFKALGFKMEIIRHTAKTVKTLPRDSAVQTGYFVALVSGHILAIVNGKVEDHSEGSSRRIKLVGKILPVVSRKERARLKAEIMKG